MPPSRETYDIVIIGGGVIGSAVAYFLGADPDFLGSILVVERDPSYADATSARSVGGIRQQFSTPENIRMSLFGAEFFAAAAELLAVDGDSPNLSYVEGGYLFLTRPEGMETLRANHALQLSLGAKNMLLTPAELAGRFPWLSAEDLAGGSLGLRGEGWIDPYALLQAFRRKAIALGVEYCRDEAVGFDGGRRGDQVETVQLASGRWVACGAVVDAAGPQAGDLAALAGIALPVRPRKRCVFVFDCRTRVPCRQLVIDPSGVFFRPEGGYFITGVSPPAEHDPDCRDFEVDYAIFEETIWPVLAARVPAFAEIKMLRAWACHYEYNTLDQNAIIGPHPEVTNFFFVNGFSGHGVQQSPAAGRAIAELILQGRFTTLDLSRFSYQRIVEDMPIRESEIV
jgi:FAD-dependent oxidoreductase domain-containing protein 1